MPWEPGSPDLEFRAVEYRRALGGPPPSAAEAADADVPVPRPCCAAQLRPARRGIFVMAYVNGQGTASGGYRTFRGDESGGTAELVELYVRPDARVAGLGRALLVELEARAVDDEYRRTVLRPGAGLPGAALLYRLLGYQPLGERPIPRQLVFGKELPEVA